MAGGALTSVAPARRLRFGAARARADARLSADWVEALAARLTPASAQALGGAPLPGLPHRDDLRLLESPLGTLVAKRHDPSGLRRARAVAGRGRGARAFALGRRMVCRGVATPLPVAWLCLPRGVEVLLTPRVEGRSLFERPDATLWEALAAAVARLHLAGFTHRDLKAPTLVVGDAAGRPRPWLLDLDGAARTASPPPRRAVVRDAARLAASFFSQDAERAGIDARDAELLLTLLARRVPSAGSVPAFVADVLAAARRKAERNRRLGRPLA